MPSDVTAIVISEDKDEMDSVTNLAEVWNRLNGAMAYRHEILDIVFKREIFLLRIVLSGCSCVIHRDFS